VRLVLIGLVAGFFSALFGVGGGIVIVPLLLLVCGWEARSATATSLAAIGITAVSGVIAYAIHGDVNVGYAALVGLPAAGSVAFATSLQQRLRSGTVEVLFAGFMLAVAVWLLVKCPMGLHSPWVSVRACSPGCSVSGAASSSFLR
jgi:uncharacterized membrane protein YfcA